MPDYGGNGQIGAVQMLTGFYIIPGKQLPVQVNKGLHGKTAYIRFNLSVFINQRFMEIIGSADQGPIGLLIVKITRIQTATSITGNGFEKIFFIAGKFIIADNHFPDCITTIATAF